MPGNGGETLAVLSINGTPHRVLVAGMHGGPFVGVDEKVRPAGRPAGPADVALDHDGTVAAAMRIVGGTHLRDVLVFLGTVAKYLVGRYGPTRFGGIFAAFQYALEYSRPLGAVPPAGVGVACVGLDEGADVVDRFRRQVGAEADSDVPEGCLDDDDAGIGSGSGGTSSTTSSRASSRCVMANGIPNFAGGGYG